MTSAALTTLQIAKKARARGKHKQVIILYNEPPQCGGENPTSALESITAANRERCKISTHYIPEYTASTVATNFGQALAAANNGKFTLHEPAL